MSLTAEQRKARAYGIGASEAAASIGVSAYLSELGLYLQKVADADGGAEREYSDEDLLRLDGGSALEPVILRHLERTEHLTVVDRQVTVQDPVHPWRWVTLDGRIDQQRLVEAKKTEIVGAQWGEGEEDIPDDYYCQTQQGMACTGATLVYVPVLLPRWEFAVYTIKRDQEFIDLMTTKQEAFVQRLVKRDPPPPKSLADCKLAWPKHKALKSVKGDQSVMDAATELAVIKKAVKEKLERAEKLELTIKAAMQDAEEIKNDVGRIATWKNNKDGVKFDTDEFSIKHPDLYTKFLKTVSGARVFLLKIKAA